MAHVDFLPANDVGQVEINFAVPGIGLSHSISNGENAGVRLEHDFVVLNHQRKAVEFRGNGLKVCLFERRDRISRL